MDDDADVNVENVGEDVGEDVHSSNKASTGTTNDETIQEALTAARQSCEKPRESAVLGKSPERDIAGSGFEPPSSDSIHSVEDESDVNSSIRASNRMQPGNVLPGI